MLKKLLKKFFSKDIVRQLQNLTLNQVREKLFPLSISEQLSKWERELKKESTVRLLTDGTLDQRMVTPIIIFQSGKVGSTSVHVSLMKKYEEFGIDVPVFHAHVLENIDQRIELVKTTRANPENTITKLMENKELRRQIDMHPEWSWNVISLVRDPVALKVSQFFQLLDESIPDWQQQYNRGILNATYLHRRFYEKGGIRMGGLNNWFDNQIKPIWGIDVFGTPFSKEKGYQIYNQNPKINFIIVRLEDLNRVAKDAFYEYLGIQDFTIIKTNIGTEKSYSELYNQFKSLPMPIDAVNEVYNSRYARHFYTDQEIDAFRNKWNMEI